MFLAIADRWYAESVYVIANYLGDFMKPRIAEVRKYLTIIRTSLELWF